MEKECKYKQKDVEYLVKRAKTINNLFGLGLIFVGFIWAIGYLFLVLGEVSSSSTIDITIGTMITFLAGAISLSIGVVALMTWIAMRYLLD